jgi:formamidopyrimidine-DNA glycosylase
MPELPDVQTFKEYLDATSLHQKIQNVDFNDAGMVLDAPASRVRSALTGSHLERTRRHGKYLFAGLDSDGWLVLHFGMTGFLKYFKESKKAPPHSRMLIHFSNGYHLGYDCQRKLGEIGLTKDVGGFVSERGLGPDALDPELDLEVFGDALGKSRAAVKSALMNQEALAGIGNVYSDEILFQAGIHPKKKASTLKQGELQTLFDKTQEVLWTAIESRADPERMPDSFIIPHRRTDRKCPKCGGQLTQEKISGRTGYYCPKCQKR